MRRLVLAAAVLLAIALAGSVAGQAQEPPTAVIDLGEPSLLRIACEYANGVGRDEDVKIRNCRRGAPDVVDGNRALVTAVLSTAAGRFQIKVELQKSQWWVQQFAATSGAAAAAPQPRLLARR